MTDDLATPRPARAEVTSEWLVENRARRLAYEEQRRRHMREWLRRGEPEPETPEIIKSGQARKPARGRIHDKRQSSFDV